MTLKALGSLALVPAVLLALASPIAPAIAVATQAALGCTLRFASPDGWPEDSKKALRHGPTPIGTGQRQVTAVWEDLPPGDYAVAAIHDENMNHKLDKNFVGWPKEGFGFANNPHVALSAPSFKDALVHVTCPGTEITIHTQYK
jgi:uncharacterized protein (DUF2141 family)